MNILPNRPSWNFSKNTNVSQNKTEYKYMYMYNYYHKVVILSHFQFKVLKIFEEIPLRFDNNDLRWIVWHRKVHWSFQTDKRNLVGNILRRSNIIIIKVEIQKYRIRMSTYSFVDNSHTRYGVNSLTHDSARHFNTSTEILHYVNYI